MSATITAKQVQELRERTGAGMMDCKKALTENGGDAEKAIVWLREKGIMKAAEKAARVAAEGLVEIKISPEKNVGVAVELNSETDFVAKNEEFVALAKEAATVALKHRPTTIEQLAELKTAQGDTLQERLTNLVAKIRENMKFRRVETVSTNSGVVVGYVHMGGKIGTMVVVEGGKGPQVEEAAKDVAMHIAAASPKYLAPADVDKEELEQERSIARKKLEEQNKPANIIEKIVDGQLRKFYQEVCLVDQLFVKDTEKTVTQYLKSVDPNLTIASFVRFKVGEGIEKKKSDFAAEVAAQLEKH